LKKLLLKEKHARQGPSPLASLCAKLRVRLCNFKPATDSDGTIKVVEAFFQADSALAALYKKGIVDIIMSSDSDFAIYVPDCLLLQDFRFVKATKRNQAALDKIQVASGLWATIECALDALKYPHDINKVKRAAHSLLENIRDFKNRALAAIGIGCDQYLGSIKGIGPGAVSMVVSEAMEKSVTDFKDVLLAFFTKKIRARII
jgi:hypothetical protein